MSHTKKLLVLKDVAYGVKDGSAVGTPKSINTGGAHYENLEDGSLGIFLVNTDGKPDLVVDSGASGAAQVAASAITDKSLTINVCQGRTTAGEPIVTGSFPISSVKSVRRQAYVAPVKGVVAIGYNGTDGSLNLPTIALNDEAILLSLDKIKDENNLFDRRRYNITLEAGAADYDILAMIADEVNNVNDTLQWPQEAVANILSDGSLTAYTGTPGTADFVKGSKTVTFGSAIPTGSAAGSYVAIQNVGVANNITAPATNANSFVYKIEAADATTWTLDRPYTGETQQITQTNIVTNEWIADVTVAGDLGLHLKDLKDFARLYYGVGGVLLDATITTLVGQSDGSGHGFLVTELEKEMMYYRTMVSQTFETQLKKGERLVDELGTYDIISITCEPKTTVEWGVTSNLTEFIIVCPAAATATNISGADFVEVIRDIFDASGFNVPVVSGF